mmetsp:Transcript_13972/g.16878  ORF Transcript_13972/g.16878 Transcript_13972/m.16878 type:complete len:408 (-) Transcript_13972:311-1534(-)|eukprot:CAMPEP_0197852006 /NCGR_PEP_ID=MMETSP1438-20131217/19448_1 /TAXON_ID=1461541 /ORGANISM="Pterosperma sp., Strain CCMP1384" /LENGTH=407 /DNA_ID=CAMNT_0043465841 /DNA_START=231 /DNA_END=1454 /DNA_ORIENTATION=+
MAFTSSLRRLGRVLLAEGIPRAAAASESQSFGSLKSAPRFSTLISNTVRTHVLPSAISKEANIFRVPNSSCSALNGGSHLPFGLQAIRGKKKLSKRATAKNAKKRANKRRLMAAVKDSRMKVWNPTSPGQRFRITVKRDHLWKGRPIRKLTVGLRKKGGRDGTGRIRVRHRGGGAKRRYRFVDFKRSGSRLGEEAEVVRLEYDPNRSANIALIKYKKDDELSYIIACHDMKAGDVVVSGEKAPIRRGNCLPLRNIPLGTTVHNIELYPGKGGQFSRAAGTSSRLVKKDESSGYATLKLTSGELRMVLLRCMATIGIVSNREHSKRVIGKAGYRRHMGWRPSVRGVAMNPVDHPMGGGEGKTSGGRPSVTPWGKHTKGARTRHNKRTEKYRVKRRPSNPKRYGRGGRN